MAYKCLECGHIFEEGEQANWKEVLGDFRETFSGCPICDGGYEETRPCKICGSQHLDDELEGGVCDECINEHRKDFNTCYKVSLGETSKVKINYLLACLFDASDIEQILIEYIQKNWKEVDCSPFIDSDISWFGERLAKEVKKNENIKKQP